MPLISLRACEMIEEKASDVRSGRYAFKEIDWPVVPRQGEILWIGGNSHEVYEVTHVMDRSVKEIRILFEINSFDFRRLLAEGWQLDL